MNNTEWIFFDIGSTLVDEEDCYEKRYIETVEASDISYEQFKSKVEEYAKHSSNAYKDAVSYFGLSKTKWYKELEKLYPDTKEVLKELSKRYKLGIIANQSLGSMERLNNWGIGEYISLVIASAEEGVQKPDLEIFERASSKAKCVPERAVMIGDRLDNDIVPAKQIGMKTIWIKRGFAKFQKTQINDEIPDITIDSLSELLELF